MSSLGMEALTLPDSPPDLPDDAADRRFAASVSALSDGVVDRFVDRIITALYADDDNPLAMMHQLLSGPQGVPIRDQHDALSYAQVGGPGDKELAIFVRLLYAKSNLLVADLIRGSEVPF